MINDPYPQRFWEETKASVQTWLTSLIYWYGWQRGRKSTEKNPAVEGRISLWDEAPDFEKLEFSWYRAWSRYYITIDDIPDKHLANIMMGGKSINDLLVFGQSQVGSALPFATAELMVQQVEELVQAFCPGIQMKNSLRFCSVPAHLSYPGATVKVFNDPLFHLSKKVGGRWLCIDCVERYNLEGAITPPAGANKKQQREFEKLNPALRLSIIERDGYACTECGQSPLKGDNIKLNVRYVQPVMEGGITEMPNLKTTCLRCK